MNQFDYVIVGAGSAGCVLAARLSEDPSVQVCLLEAGPRDWSPAVHVPLGVAFILPSRHMNWAFESVPQAGLNGRRSYQPRGKVLGGSSAINGMVYIRGHAADYDHWASLGNQGWSYANVLPYFKRAEHNEAFDDAFHGQGGPLNVAAPHQEFKATKAFMEMTRTLALPQTGDFNGENQEGFGYYQTTTRQGRRCSTARAYLGDAKRRSNLTIITGAHATRVMIEKRLARGVEYRRGGRLHSVIARREVIVSAGALQSPQLLMLSGIGPGRELQDAGITVQRDMPGVGRNLQDHIDLCASYRSRSTDLIGFSIPGIARLAIDAVRYITAGRGVLASNVAEAGGFWRSRETLSEPDLQFHFIGAMLDDHMRKMHWGHGFSIHVNVCRPKSRGYVGLASSDPMADPLIDMNFFQHEDDLETLVRGYKLIQRMVQTKPLKHFVAGPLRRDEPRTDEEIRRYLRSYSDDAYHPVGTCKMGNDEQAVVDDQLRVHGIERLRVVDASIMPTLVAGNTNAPTIMIAEKASDLIRGRA
jgi:choline dehydrogenase-like flavoprotein